MTTGESREKEKKMANINGKDISKRTEGKGQLVPFEDVLKSNGSRILHVLPVGLDEKYKKDMVTAMVYLTNKAYREVPELRKCSVDSIMNSLMDCASLGMMPFSKMNECAIIPYGGKANMQLMYRGIIKLCTNTGEYKNLRTGVVRVGDEFDYYKGLKQDLRHRASDMPAAKRQITHVYALYELMNGGTDFEVMTHADLEAHRDKYSKQYKYAKSKGKEKGAMWFKEFEGMSIKTVLIKLLKYAPKSDKLVQQLALDRDLKREIAPERKDFTAEKEDEFKREKIADATGIYQKGMEGVKDVTIEGAATVITKEPDQKKPKEKAKKKGDPQKGDTDSPGETNPDSTKTDQGEAKTGSSDNGSPGKDDATVPSKDTTTVTEKQIDRMFAMGNKANPDLKSEQFKNKVKAKFKLNSLKELVRFQYDEVCEKLQETIDAKEAEGQQAIKDFEAQEEKE